MLRNLNFTERLRITRAQYDITLRREDGVLAFDASIDASRLPLPGDARVYIEAMYRTSYMRFDCGPLRDMTIPADRRLTEIASDSVAHFRVKIVHEQRVLAVADNITLTVRGDGAATRVSLLPVNFSDLGDQPWRIQYEATGPVLELNNRIDGIQHAARNDPEFFALVYPAAVREILTQILIVDSHEEDHDIDEWWALWMRWSREMTELPLPQEMDDRRMWIDEVVAGFCGRYRVLEMLAGTIEEDG